MPIRFDFRRGWERFKKQKGAGLFGSTPTQTMAAAEWAVPLKVTAAVWAAKKIGGRVGLFGALGKLAGKGLRIAKGLAKTTPMGGALGKIGAVGSKLAKRIGRKNLKRIAAGAAGAAGLGVVAGGRGGGGGAMIDPTTGEIVSGRRYRRINPGNSKAMRRAIRRIEQGARLYSKFFTFKRGAIKGASGVRVKKLSIRRAA